MCTGGKLLGWDGAEEWGGVKTHDVALETGPLKKKGGAQPKVGKLKIAQKGGKGVSMREKGEYRSWIP